MHQNILNNVKSFDGHWLSSIAEEEQEEQKGEIEMKEMMTFVDTIKEMERRDLWNREG